MAAKLKWKAGDLWLGGIRVGETRWTSHSGHQWCVSGKEWQGAYEAADAVDQDLESEVRRLLRDAGVEVS